MEKLLLTVPEAAEALSVGRSKLFRMASAGEIPSVRLGRSVRISAEVLRHWVDERVKRTDNDGGDTR
ncbi:MAG: helix-turn-helix domain-containing protein [Chloroflexota bacterium]|nr:helix-turn-helix domain-containing protein [Chloroflexota bacterium]